MQHPLFFTKEGSDCSRPRRRVTMARIEEAEPRIRRRPVRQHTDDAAVSQRVPRNPRAYIGKAGASDSGVENQMGGVERQRAIDVNAHRLAALLELPTVNRSTTHA